MKRILSQQHGFTIIELLIVLVIAAILLTIAVPSFQESSKKSSVKALQRNYLSALSYARGEAVVRNKTISMCPSEDAIQCDTTSNDWSGGWLIFVDNGENSVGDGVYNPIAGEELLRVYENQGRSLVSLFNVGDSGSASNDELPWLSWNYRGFVYILDGGNVEEGRAFMRICDRDNTDLYARGLLIERSGRVMLSTDRDNDGIHNSVFINDTDNSAQPVNLSCS